MKTSCNMLVRKLKVKVSKSIFQKEKARFKGLSEVIQEDVYYDFPDCRNLNAKRELKLRIANGIFEKIEFETVFFLEIRNKWVVEEIELNQSSASSIFRRLGLNDVEIPIQVFKDNQTARCFFEDLGLKQQWTVKKKRHWIRQEWGTIYFEEIEGLGFFIELELAEGDPEKILAQLEIQYKRIIRLGDTEFLIDRDPKKFINSDLKEKIFKEKPSWNVTPVDQDLYRDLDSRWVVWCNLSCLVYDISVPYYFEKLASKAKNIELLYVNYWDNLLLAEEIVDHICPGKKTAKLLDENIKRVDKKLQTLLPQRFRLLMYSKLTREAFNFLQRPLYHITNALDGDRIQNMIRKSRVTLQVLNNMIIDFLLCCFSTKLNLEKVDIYYVGKRFEPLEPLFRKYCDMNQDGFSFPRVMYVDLPRFPKDSDGNRINAYMTFKEISGIVYSCEVDDAVLDWLAVSKDKLADALIRKMDEVVLAPNSRD